MKSELVENRIIVWNIEDSKKLFSEGYYGKPIGIPKPKIEEMSDKCQRVSDSFILLALSL